MTDVSIQSLCQNSILFVKELAHKRQLRLNIQLPDDLKYLNIRVDDLRFRQVSIDLLSNAVKFTPEGGTITLDVRVGELGSMPERDWDYHWSNGLSKCMVVTFQSRVRQIAAVVLRFACLFVLAPRWRSPLHYRPSSIHSRSMLMPRSWSRSICS